MNIFLISLRKHVVGTSNEHPQGKVLITEHSLPKALLEDTILLVNQWNKEQFE